jgi:predicted MFS family arabinose efflux permease
MGWHGSFMTIGMAVGAPLSGASIDAVGPWAGFAGVGAVGAVVALIGLAVQRAAGHSDTPPERAEPIPEGAALDAASAGEPALRS